MTSSTNAFERLRRAADEAERVLDSLSDQPLSERMAAALTVYTSRRALTSARAADRPAHHSAVADALADLLSGDAEPGSDDA